MSDSGPAQVAQTTCLSHIHGGNRVFRHLVADDLNWNFLARQLSEAPQQIAAACYAPAVPQTMVFRDQQSAKRHSTIKLVRAKRA
ncbi:hypothetical protein [uncultured Sphingomonas sp.]|uniref:hypothetical protein n=1 Tax=uncultured Sphingomonas sp. TaxID=158754 RepID=UPI002612FCD1|nr:hypothetical protein [uncultured Sphingomonas sp.]